MHFLIDCENLRSQSQKEAVVLRLTPGAVELFGRESAMSSWRGLLAAAGIAVDSEGPVPEDAPSQAADDLIHARAESLAGAGATALIFSNDKGFDAASIRRLGDPTPPHLLALLVAQLAGGDGWAGAAGVGDHLSRRFGLKPRGRLEAWAEAAGLETRRDGRGLWLKTKPPPGGPDGG